MRECYEMLNVKFTPWFQLVSCSMYLTNIKNITDHVNYSFMSIDNSNLTCKKINFCYERILTVEMLLLLHVSKWLTLQYVNYKDTHCYHSLQVNTFYIITHNTIKVTIQIRIYSAYHHLIQIFLVCILVEVGDSAQVLSFY